MKKIIAIVLAIGILGFAGCDVPSNPQAEKAAIESAQAWLALIDNEQCVESWEDAAGYFKAAISKDGWQAAIKALRTPLGKTISRTIKSQRYTKTLPGAPDGEYFVIQYQTVFENKKAAIETITPMLDKDGKWRISGYYIK